MTLRRSRLVRLFTACALLLVACAPAAQPTPTPPAVQPTPVPVPTPAPPPPAVSPVASPSPVAVAPVATPTPLPRIGGTVSVLAVWGGDERDAFLAMVRPFEEMTGVEVRYEGTRDINAVLTTRVQGGNPPDVAGLPGPGQMAEFARQGRLIDLSTVLDMNAMRQQYSEQWLRLAQVDGRQVGIFIKATAKGAIYYNSRQFQQQGYQPARTWDELMALSRRIADTGTAPWCIGLEAGAASGWPGTDWLEDIVLRQSGPQVYDQWWQGQIRWTSPEIRRAWETWGQIVADERMVFGGRQNMLATNFQNAGTPLFTSPPGCYLHHGASFTPPFFKTSFPNLREIQDFNFFPFPTIDAQYAGAQEIAGDLFGMFRDTPQARALMQWLTTPQAQEIWVKRGGALSANRQVPLDAYPDPISRQLAEQMNAARIVAFDASDLMPEAMNNAFWRGILDYVNNPGNLNAVLSNLDSVQAGAYR